MNDAAKFLHFDRYALDLTRQCVRGPDRDIELWPKTFDVLRCLVGMPAFWFRSSS